MDFFTKVYSLIRLCIISSIAQLAALVKVSYVFGTIAGFFSLSSLIIPAGAASFGFGSVLGASMVAWVIHAVISKSILIGLTYQLPTLCASLSFSGSRKLFYGVIPAVCMILFIAHPASIGGQAYALYWLIPMLLGMCRVRSLYLRSLAATFIAHAVGSVIWLYAGKLTGSAWPALMPIVAIERLVFAGIITGVAVLFMGIEKSLQFVIGAPNRSVAKVGVCAAPARKCGVLHKDIIVSSESGL